MIKLINDDMYNALPSIEDNSIELFFIDVPYGEGSKKEFKNEKKKYKMIHEEWDTNEDNSIEKLHLFSIQEAWRVLKPGGWFFATCSTTNKHLFYKFLGANKVTSDKTYNEEYNHNFRFINEICWHHVDCMPFMMAKKIGRCCPSSEYVMIYSKGLPKTFNYDWLKTNKTEYEKRLMPEPDKLTQMRDLWIMNTEKRNWVTKGPRHPSQKSRKLLERIILGYTNEGDTVLDPCFGSCSTGLIAKENNRNFIGIERDKEYYEQSLQLLEN